MISPILVGLGVNDQQILRKTSPLRDDIPVFAQGQAVAVKEKVVIAADEVDVYKRYPMLSNVILEHLKSESRLFHFEGDAEILIRRSAPFST